MHIAAVGFLVIYIQTEPRGAFPRNFNFVMCNAEAGAWAGAAKYDPGSTGSTYKWYVVQQIFHISLEEVFITQKPFLRRYETKDQGSNLAS
jgi:hypothetical protein